MSRPKKYTITLDDDPMIPSLIQAATGIETIAFVSAEALLENVSSYSPIAAFIDVHVGSRCGLDLLPTLRKKWFYCPILVITSDLDDDLLAKALSLGADDFISKPIRNAEVLARLQTRLNDLSSREAKSVLRISDVILDTTHRVLRGKNVLRNLSETEVLLLKSLWTANGTVVPRDTLRKHGWGDVTVSDGALDRKMYELRRALTETSEKLTIQNSYGEGFLLKVGEIMKKKTKNSSGEQRSKLFDEEKLEKLRDPESGGDEEFYKEIVTLFLSDTPPVFDQLRTAAKAKDINAIKQYAHKLKGMCPNLGASSLADACQQLEQMAHEQIVDERIQAVATYEALYGDAEDYLIKSIKVKKAA